MTPREPVPNARAGSETAGAGSDTARAGSETPKAGSETAGAGSDTAEAGLGENADPAGHGAGRIGYFTVLYDQRCPICRTARRWLAARAQLVPLEFVPAGSPEARLRFPGLDHAATLRDLTVISDGGLVYVSDAAWLTCLWALADYRGMAERLSSPNLLPTARRFIAAASAVRQSTRSGDYGDVCDDRCRPA